MPLSAASVLAASCLAIDNGIGRTPPMGWRSWNALGGGVTQQQMEAVMDALVNRSRMVNGKPTSLFDLGYVNVGLDDGWQKCGAGVNGSFHDSSGRPIIHTKKFPDMASMVSYGHSKGVRVGWYANNCICAERGLFSAEMSAKVLKMSASAVTEMGFDGLKLDSCSEFNNVTAWAELLNSSTRPVMIENCHQGGIVPGDGDSRGAPIGSMGSGATGCTGTSSPVSQCPYNFYRTSGDINKRWSSVMANVNTVVKFLGTDTKLRTGAVEVQPKSRPGAWAYPDMMEVGMLASYNESRAHFGLWCVSSAPLVLGHDLTQSHITDAVWDVVSNTEAIAVNQAWSGSPGQLLSSTDPTQANRTDALGFVPFAGALMAGSDVRHADAITLQDAEHWCASNSSCLGFTYRRANASTSTSTSTAGGTAGAAVEDTKYGVYFKSGITLNGDADWASKIKKGHTPPGPETRQVWAKRLDGGGSVAVLFVNGGSVSNATHDSRARFKMPLSDLGFTASSGSGSVHVRDIWKHEDSQVIPLADGAAIETDEVPGHDSRFYKLTFHAI